jgi:hypothetical protein
VPGAVADLLGDTALLATRAIVGPLLGQIEPEGDQDVLAVGDGAEGDPDLAVLDLTEATAPLALDPDGRLPLPGESRGIEDEHGIGAAQGGGDLAVQLIRSDKEPRKNNLVISIVERSYSSNCRESLLL